VPSDDGSSEGGDGENEDSGYDEQPVKVEYDDVEITGYSSPICVPNDDGVIDICD
jgi:hypothetical protein